MKVIFSPTDARNNKGQKCLAAKVQNVTLKVANTFIHHFQALIMLTFNVAFHATSSKVSQGVFCKGFCLICDNTFNS